MEQKIIKGLKPNFKRILKELNIKKYLLVCGNSFKYLNLQDIFDSADTPYVTFRDFTPNPSYEEVCKGVQIYNSEQCDSIVVVGGGSAIDVAKCIKLFCKMDSSVSYLKQEYLDTMVPLVALPTTAGTGSESTRYSVIYYEEEKQSVTHNSIIPNYVVLEPDVLKMLPSYQKKCTLLDALSQAIEAWWSINSTEESKEYSKKAVKLIMDNYKSYITDFSHEVAEKILLASNYAGQAINITQTTAPHAMSYKLTSMFNLPHGHAVALCLPEVFHYMVNNLEKTIDRRGKEYLADILNQISHALGCQDPACAVNLLHSLLVDFELSFPSCNDMSSVAELAGSVNSARLKNNPVQMDVSDLNELYKKIVRIED